MCSNLRTERNGKNLIYRTYPSTLSSRYAGRGSGREWRCRRRDGRWESSLYSLRSAESESETGRATTANRTAARRVNSSKKASRSIAVGSYGTPGEDRKLQEFG